MENQIVITKYNNVDSVDSRLIANELGIQHKNLLELVKKYQSKIESRFGLLAFETLPRLEGQHGGGEVTIYHLNENQAIFASTLSRNTEKGVEVKLKIVEAFSNARAALIELLKPKSDIEILADAIQVAQRVIANKDEEIKKLAPKAEYTDKVLQSNTTMTITDVAKDLGITANRLNEFLCEQKVQTKHRDHYVLLAKHQGKGYERMTTQMIVRNNEAFTKMQLEWTERGRAFIHFLYNQNLSFSKNPLLSVQGSIQLGKY